MFENTLYTTNYLINNNFKRRDMTSKKKLLVSSVIAGAIAIAVNTASAEVHDKNMEKRLGVVKAGMNDCKAMDGSHLCAGHSTKDGDMNEWLMVPKGLCDKLMNGKVSE